MTSRRHIILLLGLLVAIGPLSIDMYLPAFSELQKVFSTTDAKVQLTLASFFMGFSLGQLVYGPLSDHFGRKPLLYLGLAIYALSSLGCALAWNIESLIFLRFMQALGGCSGVVLGRAMVRDLFKTEEIAHVFSLITLVMGLAPILAPIVGGEVLTRLGWQSIFYVLVAFSLLALLLSMTFLPETQIKQEGKTLTFKHVFQQYKLLLADKSFMKFALAGGLLQAGMFAYISGSPFVYMELHHISEQHYGYFFGTNALGLITFSQLNRRLSKSFSFSQILTFCLMAEFFIGLFLTVAADQFWPLPFVATGLFFFTSFMGLVFPNSTAGALAKQSKRAGTASALLGTLQFLMASISSTLVGLFHDGTGRPMALVMTISAALAFGLFRLLKDDATL